MSVLSHAKPVMGPPRESYRKTFSLSINAFLAIKEAKVY